MKDQDLTVLTYKQCNGIGEWVGSKIKLVGYGITFKGCLSLAKNDGKPLGYGLSLWRVVQHIYSK